MFEIAGFIISLSRFKANVDIIFQINLKNVKLQSCIRIFNSNIRAEHTTSIMFFQTPSEMNITEIRVRYAELMALLSAFKGTVDIN